MAGSSRKRRTPPVWDRWNSRRRRSPVRRSSRVGRGLICRVLPGSHGAPPPSVCTIRRSACVRLCVDRSPPPDASASCDAVVCTQIYLTGITARSQGLSADHGPITIGSARYHDSLLSRRRSICADVPSGCGGRVGRSDRTLHGFRGVSRTGGEVLREGLRGMGRCLERVT
jgi:hypothetical protein